MIEAVVTALVAEGWIDDRRLAESRTRSMRIRGKSTRAVRFSLRHKGVESAVVEQVLRDETLPDGDIATPARIELEAARALVRRKKLGAMRTSSTPEQRTKDLAAVARGGFSYGVAKRALETPHGDED